MRPWSRCGRDAPTFRLSLDDVRRNGWTPPTPAAFVNWCGHVQEFVPIRQADDGLDRQLRTTIDIRERLAALETRRPA